VALRRATSIRAEIHSVGLEVVVPAVFHDDVKRELESSAFETFAAVVFGKFGQQTGLSVFHCENVSEEDEEEEEEKLLAWRCLTVAEVTKVPVTFSAKVALHRWVLHCSFTPDMGLIAQCCESDLRFIQQTAWKVGRLPFETRLLCQSQKTIDLTQWKLSEEMMSQVTQGFAAMTDAWEIKGTNARAREPCFVLICMDGPLFTHLKECVDELLRKRFKVSLR